MKQIIDGVWHLQSLSNRFDSNLLKENHRSIFNDEFDKLIIALKAKRKLSNCGWRDLDYSVDDSDNPNSGLVWHIDAPSRGGIIKTSHANYMLFSAFVDHPFDGKSTLIQDAMGFVTEAKPWNIYLFRWNIPHRGPKPHGGVRILKRHYLWIDDHSFDYNYSE